ncbi:MAG: Gfo/Idh/MocA family oxidoreductase [Burkholderiales bacterium]|nr:Gfo/Idh/MocA family oxidoreductase [Opitutaceae bacterium]
MKPTKSIKLGIVGVGGFLSEHFLPVFRRHPGIGDIYLADLEKSRADALLDKFNIAGTVRTLDELIALGVDAVAIFTPRHTHAALAQTAMEAGCHVYMAVPAAVTLDELSALVETSGRTRRVCMTGETSYYYPEIVYCREEYATGRWGKFVHADAQYIHDMATWGPHFLLTAGADWRRFAAIPPMHYATHSFSMPLSITGARVTHVSSHGFKDLEPGSGYGEGENPWDNPFSNEVTTARTSDGGTLRIGEFRRIGWFAPNGREVMMPSFYCTDACFEENVASTMLVARQGNEGGRNWEHGGALLRNLREWVECPYFEHASSDPGDLQRFLGVAPAHFTERLPDEYRGLANGHNGSHHFLVDDFVRACQQNALPPCHIWNSAAWCAPGLVAHESSRQGGALLTVPDLGQPPADWPLISLPVRPFDARRPSLPALETPG